MMFWAKSTMHTCLSNSTSTKHLDLGYYVMKCKSGCRNGEDDNLGLPTICATTSSKVAVWLSVIVPLMICRRHIAPILTALFYCEFCTVPHTLIPQTDHFILVILACYSQRKNVNHRSWLQREGLRSFQPETFCKVFQASSVFPY